MVTGKGAISGGQCPWQDRGGAQAVLGHLLRTDLSFPITHPAGPHNHTSGTPDHACLHMFARSCMCIYEQTVVR